MTKCLPCLNLVYEVFRHIIYFKKNVINFIIWFFIIQATFFLFVMFVDYSKFVFLITTEFHYCIASFNLIVFCIIDHSIENVCFNRHWKSIFDYFTHEAKVTVAIISIISYKRYVTNSNDWFTYWKYCL